MAEHPDPPQPNPRRLKRGSFIPRAETLALPKISDNPINGLGETTVRRASPFFWHPPDQHPCRGRDTWQSEDPVIYRERAPGIITHGYSDVTETAIALVQRRLSDQEWYR